MSPEKGAQTSLYLATSPDVAKTSGQYFIKSKPARPAAAAHDHEAARRLWQVSKQLVGLS
jgi:hypothetical protein